MDEFEEEPVICIDCGRLVFAAASNSSIRIYDADFTNLSAWPVTPDLQPISDIRFDESAQYLAVVGPKFVRVFKVDDEKTFFDLDGNGDNLVGLRFHGGAVFVATDKGFLLTYQKREEEMDIEAAPTEEVEGATRETSEVVTAEAPTGETAEATTGDTAEATTGDTAELLMEEA